MADAQRVEIGFEGGQVISTRLVAGIPVVHVYSEGAPGNGFAPVEPSLEDAYFHRVGARAEA